LGQISNIISGLRKAVKSGLIITKSDYNNVLKLSKRYINYPKFNGIPALINSASLLLPVLMVNRFYEEAITGQFDLCRIAVVVPSAIISMSISQVLYQRISQKKNSNEKITSEIFKLTGLLFLFSLVEVFILKFWAVQIYTFVFGPEWELAGEFAKILAIAFGVSLIASPLSVIFIALEELKISAVWQICYFIAILCLLYLGKYHIFSFLKVYMWIDIIFYSVYLILIFYVSRKYDKSLLS